MGSIKAVTGFNTRQVLFKGNGTFTPIQEVMLAKRIACNQYIRNRYFIKKEERLLPRYDPEDKTPRVLETVWMPGNEADLQKSLMMIDQRASIYPYIEPNGNIISSYYSSDWELSYYTTLPNTFAYAGSTDPYYGTPWQYDFASGRLPYSNYVGLKYAVKRDSPTRDLFKMPQVSLFRKMPFGFLRIVDQYVNYNNNALQHYSIEQDSDDGVLYLTPFPTNHAVEKTYDCGFAFPYRTDINTNTNSTTAKVREIARYDPVWCSDYVFTCQGVNCFQWYMSPPLRTTEDDVVLCDAVNKRYPVVNGRFRTLPHFMCKNDSVPVNITGNLNAGIVFDNPALRDIYDNVSGLCFCGPYLDENLNPVSYQDKPSAYPLFRFETSFTQPETPMFVEFMHTNPYTAMGMTTPDAFRYGGGGRNGGSGSLGSWFSWGGTLDQSRVVYPKHILIEGRLKQADPWEILDVVELPERALNFPLFHLSYTRTVRFLRFTVLSIHYAPTMQITVTEQGRSNTKAVVNTFPQYFYFPRTLFYPKNPKFL